MAAHLLILLLLCLPLTALGATGELCLACHPRHYGAAGGCGDCHRGNPASKRLNVAHQGLVAGRHVRFALQGDRTAAEGERLVERLGCRRCHVIGGRGNRLATSLDRVMARRSSAELIGALKNPAAAMPDFRLAGEGIDRVITALYAAAGKGVASGEPPLAVHFRRDGSRGNDPFAKCAPCHRALSSRFGAVGSGGIGPDLSGLFSPFYPNAPGGEHWTVRRLAAWLKNPRSIRPWSIMRPVALTYAELLAIEGVLAVRTADPIPNSRTSRR